MPSRDWQHRVQDILAAITGIQRRTAGIKFEDFQRNETIAKAVLYDFMIIGEASRNLPSEIQSCYPQTPWRLMGSMRNVMAHEYFQVNLERVWRTIHDDLPLLVSQLEDLLEQEAREEP